jgi:RHH-type proline utilization regulon transcriptional repressor/proline dehydrogenase/delta 1-pyrroline-5-carboxylate dehydrogenase
MSTDAATSNATDVSEEAIALVRTWLERAAQHEPDVSATRLAGVLRDENGLAFTVGFVDGVVRPEDHRVAASALHDLVDKTPRFLPWHLRAAIAAGGRLGPVVPGAVVPVAREVMRRMVSHLVLDARPERLGASIARLRAGGNRLNINLLGEAVLGEAEADRRLEGTRALLARDDVDYVSIKVSSIVSQLSMWSFDEAVVKVVEKLTPLYELAAAASTPKFINLDMEEYRDLDLTIAVFQRLLGQPQLRRLEAGIVLQTYLPDALGALQRLTAWATERVAGGGAPIKVRIVKGANLSMERVDAAIHGWPLATWGSKQESDTHYKRVLEWALRPEHTAAVRIGVAGHNLFDIAWSWLVAGRRGVRDRVDYEMLLGMAPGQAAAVSGDVGRLLLYTPVVDPREFDVAISYLIRRLEENASSENFMSAVFDLATDQGLFARERDRFLRSLGALDDTVPSPHRVQDRTAPVEPTFSSGFRNAPDTDPALAANRAWGREALARSASTELGVAAIAAAQVATADQLTALVETAATAGRDWGARPAAERAAILRRAGDLLEERRGRLLEIMAAEAGKTIAEADPEVSEAIDFARYYAMQAEALETIDGAQFVPSRLTVVTPPWNFPVAIPAGSVLAALAAGSAVAFKPARLTQRCGAVVAEALWDAGVPRDVLTLLNLAGPELGTQLVSHPAVDRVILTGSYETAELFRSFRPDLPLLAETSGKNAIIVTPSADLDLAAADVVKSAFGHAGQKCSAASLVILVGSVATSARFRSQLVDAVRSLRVGYPQDPATVMGPLVEPAKGKLLGALTTLEPGQRWLVEPTALDDSGKLWSPGVREGVAPGSEMHLTEYFGPVLGIMTAPTLDAAIELQNAVAYGLTAGLHSLDVSEVEQWIDRVQAGNLYVNRGITGAIVQRQPFGGWKRSAVGAGAKAGGPNYLLGLGSFVTAPSRALGGPLSHVARLLAAAASSLTDDTVAMLRRAVASDAAAWVEEFGVAKDVSALGVERNVFRYRPAAVTVRLADGAAVGEGIRVIAAALAARADFDVSTGIELPEAVLAELRSTGVAVRAESDAAWQAAARGGDRRVRLVGASASAALHAAGGSPDLAIWDHPVTEAGRVEMLPFLLEQAVSITAHRFGNPSPMAGVRV